MLNINKMMENRTIKSFRKREMIKLQEFKISLIIVKERSPSKNLSPISREGTLVRLAAGRMRDASRAMNERAE